MKKRAKNQRMRAPCDVRGMNQHCELKRDNISTGRSWILMQEGGGEVTICNQRPGENSTGTVRLSRADFLKFARWFQTPQPIQKRADKASHALR